MTSGPAGPEGRTEAKLSGSMHSFGGHPTGSGGVVSSLPRPRRCRAVFPTPVGRLVGRAERSAGTSMMLKLYVIMCISSSKCRPSSLPPIPPSPGEHTFLVIIKTHISSPCKFTELRGTPGVGPGSEGFGRKGETTYPKSRTRLLRPLPPLPLGL